MEKKNYAYRVFMGHIKFFKKNTSKFVFLELGPGDSLISGIIASYFGAKKIYLVDNGSFVNKRISLYIDAIKYMNQFFPQRKFDHLKSFNDILKEFNIHFLINGLASLKKIESNSIDFIYSQAVLEHIFLDEIDEIFTELNRVMKRESTSSHVVDFKDHLGSSLNNLRFSDFFWNSKLIRESGFYTNRLRLSDYVNICKSKNFNVAICEIKKWRSYPIKKTKLHKDFKRYSKQDLLVKEARLVLSKK